jgi:hypothetical protein
MAQSRFSPWLGRRHPDHPGHRGRFNRPAKRFCHFQMVFIDIPNNQPATMEEYHEQEERSSR